MRGAIASPRYSSSGGTVSEKLPNTSPWISATRSLRGPWSCMQNDGGMPPLPLTPSLKATPMRLPCRS